MIRSILAVLAGPVVYGIIMLPVNKLVTMLAPGSFREDGTTDRVDLLILLLGLSCVYAAAGGYVGAWIARENLLAHAIAMSVLQLAIGIMVQRQFWDMLPVWYHFSFFVLLVIGTLAGFWLRTFGTSASVAGA